MTITPATSEAIPEIVALLKSSLGETSSPKSDHYWRWKHIENPFGASPVLLCREGEQLIGVRAFMHWKWQRGAIEHAAVRAVDTATHPLHQGKGIFKKLTMQLVNESTANGIGFVFNTPNTQSSPGYLKMGWQQLGHMPVHFKPVLPQWFKKNTTPYAEAGTQQLASLCNEYNLIQAQSMDFFTPKSPEYLDWRYKRNPVIKYTISSSEDFFIACYIKRHKMVKELRLSECIVPAGNISSVKAMKNAVNRIAATAGAHVISFSRNLHAVFGGLLARSTSLGPMVTLRRLSATDEQWNNLMAKGCWNFVLGDMELF